MGQEEQGKEAPEKGEEKKEIGFGGSWPTGWSRFDREENQPHPHLYWMHENRRVLVLPVERKWLYFYKFDHDLSETFNLEELDPESVVEMFFIPFEVLKNFVEIFNSNKIWTSQ
jgi:hypothetical protein